jgi:hypothetical protein
VLRIKDDAVKEIAVFPLEPLLEAISGGERGSFLI